jgi:FkbM family methyltransferase
MSLLAGARVGRLAMPAEILQPLHARVAAVGGVDQVNRLRERLAARIPMALFGAGNIGRQSLSALRSLGVEPVCFADETPGKIGQAIEGVAVCTLREAACRIGPSGLFLCTFYSPRASLSATCARIYGELGQVAASFLPLIRLVPSAFPERYAFEASREAVEESLAQVDWLFQRLTDESSRALLAAQQAFRLTLDSSVLPPPGPPLGALAENGVAFEPVTFVDCGAYDGDTVNAFLEVSGGRFRRIVAYEPDAGNFALLQGGVERLPLAWRERIDCRNAGVWSEDTVAGFSRTGTPGSALRRDGSASVQVVALDGHVPTDGPIIFKLDVEGAEAEALRGAAALLSRHRAIACVSVYHQPQDLWRLPMLIDEIAPGRRLQLRAHGYDGADLMVYAFPPIAG